MRGCIILTYNEPQVLKFQQIMMLSTSTQGSIKSTIELVETVIALCNEYECYTEIYNPQKLR